MVMLLKKVPLLFSVLLLAVVAVEVKRNTPHGLPPSLPVLDGVKGVVPRGAHAITTAFSRLTGLLHLFTIADGKFAEKVQYASGVHRFEPWRELATGLANVNSASPDDTPASGAVGSLRDGRMIILLRGPKDHLEVRWETVEEPCRWSRLHGIPGRIISSPKVVSSRKFGAEVFAIGSLGQIARTWMPSDEESEWVEWQAIPGTAVRPESMTVTQINGETHVFAVEVGPKGRIVHASRASLDPEGEWSELEFIDTPVPVSFAPEALGVASSGTLEVFATGSDGHLYHTAQRRWAAVAPEEAREDYESEAPSEIAPFAALTRFEALSETFQFQPSAQTNLDGRVSVVALSKTGSVWIRWQVRRPVISYGKPVSNVNDPDTVRWSEWHNLGGDFLSRPRLVMYPNGQLAIYAIGREVHAPVYASMQAEVDAGFPAFTVLEGRRAEPKDKMLVGFTASPPMDPVASGELTIGQHAAAPQTASQLLSEGQKIRRQVVPATMVSSKTVLRATSSNSGSRKLKSVC